MSGRGAVQSHWQGIVSFSVRRAQSPSNNGLVLAALMTAPPFTGQAVSSPLPTVLQEGLRCT